MKLFDQFNLAQKIVIFIVGVVVVLKLLNWSDTPGREADKECFLQMVTMLLGGALIVGVIGTVQSEWRKWRKRRTHTGEGRPL
jgi:hypothetical protein